MCKFKKIYLMIISIVLFTFLLSSNIYAKYKYKFEFCCYELKRDISDIKYQMYISESDKKYTNKDVVLKINTNKEISNINGFELSKDRKSLTKVIKENENGIVNIEDLSGNRINVNYNVSNIDKIPPKILGIINGETYQEPQRIEYSDNVGIKDIFVDKYSFLNIQCNSNFYDTDSYYGIDITGSFIKVNVISHPINTYFYNYYINDELKETTKENNYKFEGLEDGKIYKIKIEALDENKDVISFLEKNYKTGYFKNIISRKDSKEFFAEILDINDIVDEVYYTVWSDINFISRKNYKINTDSERNLKINFKFNDICRDKNGTYFISLNMYSKKKLVNNFIMYIKYEKNYISSNKIDLYNIVDDGNYQIVVTDFAENKTEYRVKINTKDKN